MIDRKGGWKEGRIREGRKETECRKERTKGA